MPKNNHHGRNRGNVNPDQTRVYEDRWPGDAVDVVIRRNIVTAEGLVLVPDPARHEVTGTRSAVSAQDREECARHGVVMAVNRRTGEYVTYAARDTSGVWRLGEQVDQGAAVGPAVVVPDWLANGI